MITGKQYDKGQVEKLGNAVIYLAERINYLSKTKLLKLIYLIEETNIKRYGMPFFHIDFDLWRLGPVYKDLYIDLSSDGKPILLAEHITTETDSKGTFIRAKKVFCDDEFSELELELLDIIAQLGKTKNAEELVQITHREHHPWHITAKRYDVLEAFEQNRLNATDHKVDMLSLFGDDEAAKEAYSQNVEHKRYSDQLKGKA